MIIPVCNKKYINTNLSNILNSVLKGGVEIRSIRYNASYRKPAKKSEIRRYDLIEPLPVDPNSDPTETLSDFGVVFCIDDYHLKVSRIFLFSKEFIII